MRTILIIVVVIVSSSLLFADIIYVPADTSTIQGGIYLASDGDTVLVDPGTWVQGINFNGKSITVGSLFLTTGETSYISGTVIDGNQTSNVVTFANGEDSTTLLSGFTLQNGSAEMGGGIFCDQAGPNLKNLIVRNNSGVSDGGGMSFFGSSVSIENVTVEGNTAEVGAGIFCAESDLFLKNVIVYNNSALREGGGFQVHRSNLQIDSCTISNNQAQEGRGGGFQYLNDEGGEETFEINITNTDFIGNSSTWSGGGMAVGKFEEDSSIVNILIDKCEFRDNISDHYSGLRIKGESMNYIITSSSFVGNDALTYGAGGGFSSFSTGEVSNCLFAFNTAATDGEEWNSGGVSVWSEARVDFTNCTFVDNWAAYGAGITVGGGGIATTTNCIFWGNTEDQIALEAWDNVGGTLTVSYCDVEGGQDDVNSIDEMSTLIWGEGNINVNPRFVDLENEDFHLTDYSLCIGSGTSDGAPTLDIEGNSRPNPAESNPDMGAYENSLGTSIPSAAIKVSTDLINFGPVVTGTFAVDTLLVTNSGTESLTISDISSDTVDYTVDTTHFTLNPGEHQEVLITFKPRFAVPISGVLTIRSNDPTDPQLTVRLEGEGIASYSIAQSVVIDIGQVHNFVSNATTGFTGGSDNQNFMIGRDALDKPSMIWLEGGYAQNHYLYYGSFRIGCNNDLVRFHTATSNDWMVIGTDTTVDVSFSMTDKWAGLDNVGIKCVCRVHAEIDTSCDDSFIYEYLIINRSGQTLVNVYAGLHIDGDISSAGAGSGSIAYHRDDLVGYYIGTDDYGEPESISYMYDGDNPDIAGDDTGGRRMPKESLGYLGSRVLKCPESKHGVVENHQSGHYWWDWNSDPDSTSDWYDLMAAETFDIDPDTIFDYRYFQTLGPWDIAPDDTVIVAFALGLGEGLDGLRKNLQNMYNHYWSIEPTDIDDAYGSNIPKTYALSQNFPNPFNPVTIINYQLPLSSEVELNIYNLLGQKVASLVSENQKAGHYSVQWDASGFASGVYYYRLKCDADFVQTKKLVLLK